MLSNSKKIFQQFLCHNVKNHVALSDSINIKILKNFQLNVNPASYQESEKVCYMLIINFLYFNFMLMISTLPNVHDTYFMRYVVYVYINNIKWWRKWGKNKSYIHTLIQVSFSILWWSIQHQRKAINTNTFGIKAIRIQSRLGFKPLSRVLSKQVKFREN